MQMFDFVITSSGKITNAMLQDKTQSNGCNAWKTHHELSMREDRVSL